MTRAASITVRVPLAIRRRPGRKTVVMPEGGPATAPPRTRADPALKALARAFRYQRLLDGGCYASISEMAKAEKIKQGYLGRLLRLTLLAPAIVEAIVDGRQAVGLTLPESLEPFSPIWTTQRIAFRCFRPLEGAFSVLHRRHGACSGPSGRAAAPRGRSG